MGTKERRKLTLDQALEQNADYYGFDLCDEILIGDEVFEIRYREFLDAETRKRVNAAYQKYNDCEKEVVTLPGGKEITTGYKEPRVHSGVLFDLDEAVSRALWGDDKYERWIAAGGPPGLVQIVWNRMRHQFNKRLNEDSKSS